MSRRASSGISLGPVLVMLMVVFMVVIWNRTNAPEGTDRFEGDFSVLAAVRLAENRGNDGDSFKVQHGNEIETYRLYFVDTCEKSDRFRSRIQHQARYFGGLKESQVLQLGERARDQTLEWLRNEAFEVYTRGERVMDSERHHAMIHFPNAEQGHRWLSERLVREGLARIYTRGTDLADGTSRREFEGHLRDLEAKAKQAGRGAWGL